MTIVECARLIRDAEELVVVCGAGLSADVAPLAQAIENGLWAAVTHLAADGRPVDLHRVLTTGNEVHEPYLTLELLVSGLRHRVPDLAGPLQQLYRRLFQLKANPGRANRALARALATVKARRIVVLSSNFDDGLTVALRTNKKVLPYRLVTDANVRTPRDPASRIEICAYHGTVDEEPTDADGTPPTGPTSMAARDLAHPFAPDMATYIDEALAAAAEKGLVLFVGHRGEDYYDLNIRVRLLAERCGKADAPGWRSRFMCIPHKGELTAVSDFYRTTFTDEVVVKLTDGTGDDWLSRLFDTVFCETAEAMPATTTASDADLDLRSAAGVEACFSGIVRSSGPWARPGGAERIRRQCAALLDDIEAGILAAWSVTEHYRLESIGYEQPEIAAFGRPGLSRRFHGVPVAELIGLQDEYQKFRKRIDGLRMTGQDGTALADGFALMRRLEHFSEQALRAMGRAPVGAQRAMAALLAAIGYDYAGLIAMRCERAQRDWPASDLPASDLPDAGAAMAGPAPARDAGPQDLARAVAHLDAAAFAADRLRGADGLFAASVALARWAGDELAIDARMHEEPGKEAGYAESLAQIVAWQDWTLAPEENRLRLPLPQDFDEPERERRVQERIDDFVLLIRKRIERIGAALGTSVAGRSFSAAGDAAQCSQRLNEVMRLVMGVGEKDRGPPTGSPYAGDRAIEALVAEIAGHARSCLAAGETSSSVRNFRFLAAYEARALAALFANDPVSAHRAIAEGETYAQGRENSDRWSARLQDLCSRRPPQPAETAP